MISAAAALLLADARIGKNRGLAVAAKRPRTKERQHEERLSRVRFRYPCKSGRRGAGALCRPKLSVAPSRARGLSPPCRARGGRWGRGPAQLSGRDQILSPLPWRDV